MISSGFVDLQVNGYSGVDFSKPGLSVHAVMRTSQELYRRGTVAFLPTLVTTSTEAYFNNLPVISKAEQELAGLPEHAQIAGIHLEGPFISPQEGARGVHPLVHTRLPSISEFDRFFELSNGTIRLITLAPELQGANRLIDHAVELGVQVSIGHTLADTPNITDAVAAGARYSTHLGNGLPMNIHRHSNPLWTQLANPSLTALIIADGHHLPAEFVQVVLACKGSDHVIVTSDASPIAGCPPGEYYFFEARVKLEPDGRLSDPNSGYLAGSSATMKDCAAWLSSIGFDNGIISKLCYRNACNAFRISTSR